MPGHVRTSANLDDIVGKEKKIHILIRTKSEKIEHKFEDKVPRGNYCFWTMLRPPKTNALGLSIKGVEGNKIMFSDGKNVIGEGTIIEVIPTKSIGSFDKNSEDVTSGEIRFTPLKRVCYPQPKKAPTRGFTYVEIEK